MTTEHQMPEGLEGLGEMLVEMDPRMAAGMVAGMLQASGCPDPDFDAVELTRLVTGQDPRLSETPLTEEQAARLARLAALRFERRPLQYIEGKWGFLDFEVQVGEGVLIPRQDSEAVCLKAIDLLKGQAAPAVLDLCAGSGCVGLAVAKFCPGSHVVLGELMEGALRVCRRNIRRSGLTSQVMPWQVDALDGPPPRFGEFDCIVSNPPYIPDGDIAGLDVSVRDYEPLTALKGGADGLDFYRAISEKWRAALHPGSRLFFEVGIGQADDVLRIMRAQGFGDIEIIPDTAGIPRVVYGTLYDSVFDNGES